MDWEGLLSEAEACYRDERYHDALQLCDRAAQGGEDARYHAALLRGDVLLALGDPAGALSSFESIADPAIADPDVDCARGIALFELGMLPEADSALRSAVRGRPDLPDAYYALALVAEIMNTGEEVELFRRARRLDPVRFPPRGFLSRQTFEAVIDRAMAELPQKVQEAIAHIPILIAEVPHLDELRRSDPPLSPTTLGMFVGTPPHEHSVLDPPAEEQPKIILYKKNLERAFPDREELIDQIRRTVIHEVGHAIGLSEDDLWARGLE